MELASVRLDRAKRLITEGKRLSCSEAEALLSEVERLKQAAVKLIGAVEQEDELLENSGEVWDAYETAREVLGDPVKTYPGGYESHHIHHYGWTEQDGCDTCDDYIQARAESGVDVLA